MSKEIRRIPIKKENLPKNRDPFHKILTAKSGITGRLPSQDPHYRRHQAKLAAHQEIEHQLTEQFSEQEQAAMLQDILEQIEQWAGPDGLELGESIKRAVPEAKARWYLAVLKDELTDEYYQQTDKAVVQQKEMILNWIQQLEKLLGT